MPRPRFSTAKPRGLLRVDVHRSSGARHFSAARLRREFLAEYPDLQLHLGEGDRLVDLVPKAPTACCAWATLQDIAMIARRVATLDEATCAALSSACAHGTPRTPDDLLAMYDRLRLPATGSVMPLEFTRAVFAQIDAAGDC